MDGCISQGPQLPCSPCVHAPSCSCATTALWLRVSQNRLQAHQLFVLLGPVDAASTATPDIICVLQVCLEGQISKESVLSQLSRGYRQAGDLIPWTIAQQFQDADFAGLSGARVVRIATHPELTKMGYGGRAIDLLSKYFAGQLVSLDEVADSPAGTSSEAVRDQGVASSTSASLTEEKIGARKALPPLLVPLSQRRPEPLDYLGVSFGITSQLQRFWRRQHFQCVYLRQVPSSILCSACATGRDCPAAVGWGWMDLMIN